MHFMDSLESRQMLAADTALPVVTAKLSHTGTLFITGTSVRDTIAVGSDPDSRYLIDRSDAWRGARTEVTVHGISKFAGGVMSEVTLSFDQSKVKRINISSGAGNDYVTTNTGIAGRTVIHGGKGDDRLRTTGANQALFGESGNDELISDRGVSNVVLNGLTSAPGTRAIAFGYNTLDGGIGNDVLRSRGGDDTILGGTGDDQFVALEAGIASTAGTSLSDVNYATGTIFATSRIALDSAEFSSVVPGTSAVQVLLHSILD